MIKIDELKPIFPSVFHENFRDMLNYCAKEYGEDDAFIVSHKAAGSKAVSYEHISYIDFRNRVNWLGTAMLRHDLLGKRIAIIGKNRVEWMETYFAACGGIGICVPLDKGLPYEELESSLVRSKADVLVFDAAQRQLAEEVQRVGSTQVALYICMEPLEGYLSVPALREEGKLAMEDGDSSYLQLPVDGKATSIILFTSGTTSMAKAVQLSQQNITFTVDSMQKIEDIHRGDVNMAFLPYHHTFGSTGQIFMLAVGTTTAFCDGLRYLQKNIAEYQVSVFVCVPLLIEGIYKKIMATVKKQGMERKVNFALKLSGLLMKLGIDVRRKLFREILAQLGGNLRMVVSGAAAIDPKALEGFKAFGIETVQGYGMTEASPVLAAEDIQEQRTGSIGKAIPGVELAIDQPDENGVGELIARGANVMSGYYENEEETAKVLKDGWLHTGDLAYMDQDGYVFICGRKKNVIVLKNGKNVFPEEVELLISNLPYVEENMVFGQQRHKDGGEGDLVLSAKIVYNVDYMKQIYGEDVSTAKIEEVISQDIEQINATLPSYKQLMRLVITDQPMVKTTTGKVKRFVEAEKL